MPFIIGLLLPICFIPGITGATIPTQWPFLAIILLPGLWKRTELTVSHWIGIAFIAYAAISLTWAVNYYDSIEGMWITLIWGLCFWWGSTQPDLTNLWKGLAIGLSVNSVVAIFQDLGYHPVQSYEGNPGLFFNSTVLGAVSGIVILALILNRLWLYIPLILPSLFLAHSRAGFVVLGIGILARYVNWIATLTVLLSVGIYTWYYPHPSDLIREHIWRIAIAALKPFGWGPGTFTDIFFVHTIGPHDSHVLHPEYAHNDYLQLAFEYGIGAILPFTILCTALSQTKSAHWPLIVAISVLALFYFPLYCPVTAFVFCAVAGHILHSHDPVLALSHRCRQYFLLRAQGKQSGPNKPRRKDIPVGA